MGIIANQVQTVAELLNQSLFIPTYQRPYKWQAKHVNQLIDDILNHRTKSCYRLGTVVLHKESKAIDAQNKKDESDYAVVDGQQRLLTLTLLCAVLDEDNQNFNAKLLEQTFTSTLSIENLQHNAKVIERRLASLAKKDKQELLKFVLDKCELIEVTLDSLSEAFQFFDSQNARGKALAPYDLLKAYHLREMMDSTEQAERLHHVGLWEHGVAPDDNSTNLHSIMGAFLFRLRRWIDGDYGIQFSRHNIEVFKGINLANADYAYVETMLALDYAVQSYNADSVRQWDKQQKGYPFQVDQVMINGQRFFEYIQHYIAMHHRLFGAENALLKSFVKQHTHYKGSGRKGDSYVKNLFMCAVMHYYDKFGEIELQKAAEICFFWSYRLRLELQKIGMDSIDNHARHSRGLFRLICKAIHPQQVLNYPLSSEVPTNFKNAAGVETSINKIISGTLNEQK
jgi:hypothetical protein